MDFSSLVTACVSNVAKFVSFEIKFCFCDEAFFGFSASEASFLLSVLLLLVTAPPQIVSANF